mmetsp:Transcript_64061/g.101969  ORF Transcript_64061/g.101969 Transcript_64061/m.101969 type:complete len:306 (-) Transcript_64061:81-998(-)
MALSIHIPGLQDQRWSQVHLTMQLRTHLVLVADGDRHLSTGFAELHHVSCDLALLVGDAAANLALRLVQGDAWHLRQKVSGEFYHLRKEVLIAHVFIHGLRDHALETFLRDGRSIGGHFDLGSFEAVNVVDDAVAPRIQSVSRLRISQAIPVFVVDTKFHLWRILQEVNFTKGHGFLFRITEPLPQLSLRDVVRHRDGEFLRFRHDLLPVSHPIRPIALAVPEAIQFLSIQDQLHHKAVRIQLSDLKFLLQAFGNGIHGVPEQRNGLLKGLLATNGWIQPIQRARDDALKPRLGGLLFRHKLNTM